eukprot:gnl/MRDRNA2_/MRDRNA2_65065_c0_seq1.p1 gnl/MRDRNA2_/MRDRNA2_65065_c0~~gnl/MRDRNA2_/MRDRNA2_65065_c0_seq1.p1  ORF type:complete len:316 (+),score=65.10 gnl/MRDRNA2_/MRDRNA2_65065_c0_seq1:89-1036(+)
MGGALNHCGCAEKSCCSSCTRDPEHGNAPLGASGAQQQLDIQPVPVFSDNQPSKSSKQELTAEQLLNQLRLHASKEFKNMSQQDVFRDLEHTEDHREWFAERFWHAVGHDEALDRAFNLLDVKRDGKLSSKEIVKVIKDLPKGKMTLMQKDNAKRSSEAFLKAQKSRENAELAMIDNLLESVEQKCTHVQGTHANHYKGSRHAKFDLKDFKDFCVRELGSIKKAFEMYDVDAGGTLELAELKKHLHKMRYHGHAESIFNELDKDADGSITWHEFKHQLAKCEEIDNAAATKIQAVQRGKAARKVAEGKKGQKTTS